MSNNGWLCLSFMVEEKWDGLRRRTSSHSYMGAGIKYFQFRMPYARTDGNELKDCKCTINHK